MKRPLALVSVVGLFLLGTVVGALGMQVYNTHHPALGPAGGGIRGDGMRGRGHLAMLERMLDLTPEQTRQLDEILRESHAEGELLHAEMLPRVHGHMQRTRDRIEAILTPEQSERFEQLHRQQRGRLERFFLGQHGPPPPHAP